MTDQEFRKKVMRILDIKDLSYALEDRRSRLNREYQQILTQKPQIVFAPSDLIGWKKRLDLTGRRSYRISRKLNRLDRKRSAIERELRDVMEAKVWYCVNGVAVKIEGIPESTMGGEGGLCGKGAAGLQAG